MIRIGIIGTDGGVQSGHTLSICNILNCGKYTDVTIAGLYGENETEIRELAAQYNIPYVAKEPSDLLGRVDAVMIMFRDGNKHLHYAKPFLEAGLPMFVDKPFTCTVSDAVELIALANENGAPLCGGSYVKYAPILTPLQEKVSLSAEHIMSGYISFPILLESPFGGMHFYSHHAIYAMLSVFGTEIESVSTTLSSGKLVVIAHYKNYPVIINYASIQGKFHIGLYFDNQPSIMETLNEGGCDAKQCDLFLDMVRTGKSHDKEELLMAVKISNAIEQSLKTGQPVRISA